MLQLDSKISVTLNHRGFTMFISTLAAFSSLIFYSFGLVNGTPVNGSRFEGLGEQARDILARAVPVAPRFVVYSDKFVSGLTGPPAVADVEVRLSLWGWEIWLKMKMLCAGF